MRVFRTMLVVALAGGLLAWFLRSADLGRVWAEIGRARPGLLALTLLLTLLTYVIRAARWQVLLAPLGPTRFGIAFRTTVIGFAASSVLPARAGEVLRPFLLARSEGLAFPAVAATILVERLLDLLAVLLLLAAYLAVAGQSAADASPSLYRAVVLGAAVALPATATLLAGGWWLNGNPAAQTWAQRLLRAVVPTRWANAAVGVATAFVDGFSVVRDGGRLITAFGWSLGMWVAISTSAWVVARAFDLPVPYSGAYLLTALLVVGIAIPTPGGVGGFHEAFRLGVTAFFGAGNNGAVGAAIVLHAASFLPVLVLAAWFLLRDGMSLGSLRTLAAEPTRDAGNAHAFSRGVPKRPPSPRQHTAGERA